MAVEGDSSSESGVQTVTSLLESLKMTEDCGDNKAQNENTTRDETPSNNVSSIEESEITPEANDIRMEGGDASDFKSDTINDSTSSQTAQNSTASVTPDDTHTNFESNIPTTEPPTNENESIVQKSSTDCDGDNRGHNDDDTRTNLESNIPTTEPSTNENYSDQKSSTDCVGSEGDDRLNTALTSEVPNMESDSNKAESAAFGVDNSSDKMEAEAQVLGELDSVINSTSVDNIQNEAVVSVETVICDEDGQKLNLPSPDLTSEAHPTGNDSGAISNSKEILATATADQNISSALSEGIISNGVETKTDVECNKTCPEGVSFSSVTVENITIDVNESEPTDFDRELNRAISESLELDDSADIHSAGDLASGDPACSNEQQLMTGPSLNDDHSKGSTSSETFETNSDEFKSTDTQEPTEIDKKDIKSVSSSGKHSSERTKKSTGNDEKSCRIL